MSAAATMMLRTASKRCFMQAARLNTPSFTTSRMFSMKFLDSHEYIKVDGDIATVGISDHAQGQLGEVVYVEIPEIDEEVEKGDSFTNVESVKAASDVYAPVSGTIVEVNEDLDSSPEILNDDPEGKGWIAKIKMSDPSELDSDDLMDEEAYKKFLEESS
ncbi:glycine cleavage complex lipoylprotein [Chaetoceros tenuissimus]|uniref:Glycine cleavage system H protein n=1 Tax=Chaetoceros tenuissimus TaxID=426638 RepID=A0AAD3H5N7_9STRA|nr:glycine cleavage complex lipoylprotein [Chaetoceros tenuissimus]